MKKFMHTFPSTRIASRVGGLPVEVSLIAQLGHGAGDQAYHDVLARQQAHGSFVDELDEPSARLGDSDFAKGDPTALYSFSVGPNGHPFHRHAGHRIFTAISGSSGAQLRFSMASREEIEQSPQSFFDCLQFINIPADCLFTVRFGGETWHQFAPLSHGKRHPAFFALSCHTNELGGDLSAALREKVLANEATIPTLTELLPTAVQNLLERMPLNRRSVATIHLALEAAPGSLQYALCKTARSVVGLLRGFLGKWRIPIGFLSYDGPRFTVHQLDRAPAGSLLLDQLNELPLHHEDTCSLTISNAMLCDADAPALLSQLLQGFLDNTSTGVSGLMAVRNLLVRPVGLRTSSLGCPVSSLLSTDHRRLFDHRFPVLDQAVDPAGRRAQVVLGADDKHLVFRSCVGVEILDSGQVHFTLGTRVHCKNRFGRFYMWAIDGVHRAYVVPTMLRLAVEYVAYAWEVSSDLATRHLY